MEGKEHRVDADTERKLDSLKTDIKESQKESIDRFSEILNIHTKRMDDILQDYNKKHLEHYNDNESRRNEIYEIRSTIDNKVHTIVDDKFLLIENKIDALKESQIKMITQSEVTDRTKERIKGQQFQDKEVLDRKKSIIIAGGVGLFVIFSGMISAIFYLASKMAL